MLLNSALVYIDSSNGTETPSIHGLHWTRLDSLKKLPESKTKHLIWSRVYLLFQITNTGDAADTAFVFPAAAIKRMTIYQLDGNKITPTKTQDWIQGYEPIILGAHETKALLVSIKYYRTSIKKMKPQLISRHYFQDYKKLQQVS